MRAARWNSLYLPALFLMACSVSRAQDQTALSGNWHLTGSWDSKTNDPRLILSLGVNGDRVFGAGDLQTQCPAEGSGTGASFSVHGQISSEGTFFLADSEDPEAVLISISGKVPEPGSKQWSGSFRFVHIRDTKKCSPTVSGEFVATHLPPLKGTYSGTLLLRDRSSVTVTVDIDQGELILFDSEPSHVQGEVPLKATMTVNGSIHPTETLTADASHDSSSRIDGDGFLLVFPLDKGAKILLVGEYTDAREKTLRVLLSYPGKDLGASGFLTRR
jgi:hypothetical protein